MTYQLVNEYLEQIRISNRSKNLRNYLKLGLIGAPYDLILFKREGNVWYLTSITMVVVTMILIDLYFKDKV